MSSLSRSRTAPVCERALCDLIAQVDPFGDSSVLPEALVDDLHVEGAQWTCGSEVVVSRAADEERIQCEARWPRVTPERHAYAGLRTAHAGLRTS